MKKFKSVLFFLCVTTLLSSCEKYLTVNPKTQMPQDILFDTEGGFKDALTGVYIQMRSSNAYGGALTQTTIEHLTTSWDITTNSTEQRIGLFTFTDSGVQSSFQSIWAQEYKIISSINAILGQIDARKDVFSTPDMYETVKAECLALRAYVHLDVLRMFGPVPTNVANASPLPYVTVLSTNVNEKISFEAFKAALYKDLTEAENLLKDRDPITKYSLAQLKSPSQSSVFNPSDTFFAYRYLRMNYYAIKALEARTYLWFNENEKAYACAKIVVDATNTDGTTKFRLGTLADLTSKDYTLTPEHIFGLYDFEMATKYTSRYASGTYKKGTSATTIKGTLYPGSGLDIRETNMWEVVTSSAGAASYIIRKYQGNSTTAFDSKQIPLLRISEMYLILAETAPFNEGLTYYTTFKTARNLTTTIANAADLKVDLLKEYRREFYAEGQAFYTYKRLNVARTSIIFAPTTAVLNYVVPIPTSETI